MVIRKILENFLCLNLLKILTILVIYFRKI